MPHETIVQSNPRAGVKQQLPEDRRGGRRNIVSSGLDVRRATDKSLPQGGGLVDFRRVPSTLPLLGDGMITTLAFSDSQQSNHDI